jgi:hypothetical protein
VRIRIELSVDLDEEAWADEYGVDGAAAIRADVRGYVRNAVREHLVDRDLAREVYLGASNYRPASIPGLR